MNYTTGLINGGETRESRLFYRFILWLCFSKIVAKDMRLFGIKSRKKNRMLLKAGAQESVLRHGGLKKFPVWQIAQSRHKKMLQKN